uniref:Uncharacterized protein n=1 Tax=Micrurus surinamensis TaxID=129470 RepID=A0A2D4P908_MICSU
MWWYPQMELGCETRTQGQRRLSQKIMWSAFQRHQNETCKKIGQIQRQEIKYLVKKQPLFPNKYSVPYFLKQAARFSKSKSLCESGVGNYGPFRTCESTPRNSGS